MNDARVAKEGVDDQMRLSSIWIPAVAGGRVRRYTFHLKYETNTIQTTRNT